MSARPSRCSRPGPAPTWRRSTIGKWLCLTARTGLLGLISPGLRASRCARCRWARWRSNRCGEAVTASSSRAGSSAPQHSLAGVLNNRPRATSSAQPRRRSGSDRARKARPSARERTRRGPPFLRAAICAMLTVSPFCVRLTPPPFAASNPLASELDHSACASAAAAGGMGVAGRTAPCDSVGADAVAGALPDTGSALGSKYTTADATSPISTSPSAVLFRGANHLAPRSDEMKSCAIRLTLNMSGGIYRPKIRTIKGYDPQAFAGGPSPAERSLGQPRTGPGQAAPNKRVTPATRPPLQGAKAQPGAPRSLHPGVRFGPNPFQPIRYCDFVASGGCSNRDAGSPRRPSRIRGSAHDAERQKRPPRGTPLPTRSGQATLRRSHASRKRCCLQGRTRPAMGTPGTCPPLCCGATRP